MKRYWIFILALFFGMLPLVSNADTFSTRIIDFRDDAEEDITGEDAGDVRRSSQDLEIGNENLIEQWVGLRFQNVTIPAGSVINSAAIQFTGTTTDVGILTVPILGELSPNPIQFDDAMSPTGIPQPDSPLTGRPLTSSSASWTMDPWVLPNDVLGPNTTTPDLSSIVQEIVDQNLWEAGNSMVFILQNDSMDTSERIAVSYDGNPAEAALLVIDYSPPASDPCDFDNDGDVDLTDLDQYIGNINVAATGALAALDLDGDGTVGANDFAQHYTTCVETSNGQTGTFAGDLNLDGTVDVLGDAFALVSNLGNTVTSWSQGDVNGDGTVNVLGDAFALIGNLGKSNNP